jgi:serine/threonine protein kinase
MSDDDDHKGDHGLTSGIEAGAASKARQLYGFSTTSRFGDSADQAAFSDKEIALLSRTRHRRVVLFHGAGQLSSGQLFLVTEFMHGGDLRSTLDRNRNLMMGGNGGGDAGLLLSWRMRVSIAKDIAEGMAFLHGRQLLHRDLKSLNVLLDSHGRAKIADFGLSRVSERQRQSIASYRASFVSGGVGTDSGEGTGNALDMMLDSVAYTPAEMTGRQGTAAWMAPELEPMRRENQGSGDSRAGVEYSFGVDCYSFGIVVFEIITCRHPWQDVKFSAQIIDRVVNGERPSVSTAEEEACTLAGCAWMLELMQVCWAQDPRRRPPFAEVFHQIEQRWRALPAEEAAFSSMERMRVSYDGGGTLGDGRKSRANSYTENSDIELSFSSLSSSRTNARDQIRL